MENNLKLILLLGILIFIVYNTINENFTVKRNNKSFIKNSKLNTTNAKPITTHGKPSANHIAPSSRNVHVLPGLPPGARAVLNKRKPRKLKGLVPTYSK
jgi:hypothetical protein